MYVFPQSRVNKKKQKIQKIIREHTEDTTRNAEKRRKSCVNCAKGCTTLLAKIRAH